MKIVSIGRKFPLENIHSLGFKSKSTFLDYDLILWDPNGLEVEYNFNKQKPYQGLPSMDEFTSKAIKEDIKRRKIEYYNLLELGRTLVIFIPTLREFYIDTGKRQYSGTGRNRSEIKVVDIESIRSFIPISGDFITSEALGSQIDFRGNDIFKSFWEKSKDYLYYKAYFTHPIGKPFLFVQGTERIVGTWIRINRGNILILPHLVAEEKITDKDEYKSICRIFIDSLKEIVTSLQRGISDFTFPEWTLNYRLPEEEKLKHELKSLQDNLEQFQNSIKIKMTEISNLEKYKLLFAGKGDQLHKQVIYVLREIGIDANEGPPGRDDIIISYEGKIGVVEVKGTNKSAAESHAAQLEKWVSEYFTEHGVKPKGILMINPFCDTPLSEKEKRMHFQNKCFNIVQIENIV